VSWLETVERTVTALGYELVDTERSAGGLLRVYLDRIPGQVYDTGAGEFITVDDCEKVTRQLQHVLEVEAVAYERLEVSSPGLDRPLKRAADYTRFVGEAVALTLKMPFQGRKKFQGVLQAAEGDAAADGQAWRLVLEPAVAKDKVKGKAAASDAAQAEQVLGFTLSEVKEARLVPVIDFKGRRFAPAPDTAPALLPATGDSEDGGLKQ
jgi:ribosome maturation factor RimP